ESLEGLVRTGIQGQGKCTALLNTVLQSPAATELVEAMSRIQTDPTPFAQELLEAESLEPPPSPDDVAQAIQIAKAIKRWDLTFRDVSREAEQIARDLARDPEEARRQTDQLFRQAGAVLRAELRALAEHS